MGFLLGYVLGLLTAKRGDVLFGPHWGAATEILVGFGLGLLITVGGCLLSGER
jgi:hypothetical protein